MTDDVVCTAARRTREAGSARMWYAGFGEPVKRRRPSRKWSRTVDAFKAGPLWSEQYGVADFIGRRARTQARHPIFEPFIEDALARWPWLEVGLGEPGSLGEGWLEEIQAGGTRYSPAQENWYRGTHGSAQSFTPWILDALTGVRTSQLLGRDVVRSVATTRYACRARLEDADVQGLGHRRTTSVFANAWIDDEGLIRRVTWTVLGRGRPRLERRATRSTRWEVLELWDFGTPVEIPPPSPVVDAPETERFQITGDLIHWRREWKRRQRRGQT
jgi:hypothetical protein